MGSDNTPFDSHWAKVYGFQPSVLADKATWIVQQVARGKTVGEWKGKLEIHASPDRVVYRPGQASGCDEASASLDSVWQCLEYFGEGHIDFLAVGDWFIEFPEKGRHFLKLIHEKARNGEKKSDASLQTNIDTHFASKDLTDPFLLNLWGKYLAVSDKPGQAGAHFIKALETLKEFSEAYANLGAVLWNLGKQREAFVLFAEALLKNPHSVGASLNFFDAGYELEEHKSMINIIDSLRNDVKDYEEFQHHLAICYSKTNRRDEAISVLNGILQSKPDDEEAKTLLKKFKEKVNGDTRPSL